MSQEEQDQQQFVSIDEQIEVLTEKQIQFERDGKYVDANQTKERIAYLKKSQQNQRLKEQKQRQYQERMGVEQARNEELSQFNQFWDSKMNEYNAEADKIFQQLLQKQKEEQNLVHMDLENSISKKQKDSSEVLNLKKIEENLAKQKLYNEAHQVQARRRALENTEESNWIKVRDAKIKNQLNQLSQRHTTEQNALNKRISAGADEQRKNRQIELDRFELKYQNVIKELTDQHEKENIHYLNKFTSKVTTSLNNGMGSTNGSLKLSQVSR